MARARDVFPHPDSPMMAIERRRRMEKDTSSTAWRTPREVRKWRQRFRTSRRLWLPWSGEPCRGEDVLVWFMALIWFIPSSASG